MSGCAGSSLGSSTKLLRSCALVFSPVKWAQSLFHAHRAVAKTKGVVHRKSTIWAELIIIGLPWWLSGEESTANSGATGDVGSILGLGRSPGEGMATHSSILDGQRCLAGLQSMGSQRVRHDLATEQLLFY